MWYTKTRFNPFKGTRNSLLYPRLILNKKTPGVFQPGETGDRYPGAEIFTDVHTTTNSLNLPILEKKKPACTFIFHEAISRGFLAEY
jgi:hypothetical protein